MDLDQPDVRRETPGIPDNIGVSGPIVSDTSPMNIIQTLKDATRNEIVVIDLKEGEAWWVTRLLALSVGAVRAGSLSTFVFTGMKEIRSHHNREKGWREVTSPRTLSAIAQGTTGFQRTIHCP